MAVLNREDFMSRISTVVGTDTSDESIAFVEDMTETFDHMANQANGDGIDWKAKCEEIDKSWKAKYTHRFFNGGNPNFGGSNSSNTPDEKSEEDVSIDDLFTDAK